MATRLLTKRTFSTPTMKKTNTAIKNKYNSMKKVEKAAPYLANTGANKGIKVGKPQNVKHSSSSGSGGSGGSYVSAGYDSSVMDAYLDYMNQLQEQQRQAADATYNSNVAAMNNAYEQRSGLLKNNLDSTLKNLQTDYDASKASINNDAEKSSREAYINSMLSKKNLAQNMAAQGLSGGASETTMAGMENNYGNARNEIATTANENLGNLLDLYNKNRNSAQQAYNDQIAADALQKAQYMTQFENDRQNMLAQAYDSQLSKLMSLDPSFVAAMSGYTTSQAGYTPTQQAAASNKVNNVSTTQSGGTGGSTRNWYLNRARQLRQSGRSDASIAQDLASQGIGNSTIQYILSQLG